MPFLGWGVTATQLTSTPIHFWLRFRTVAAEHGVKNDLGEDTTHAVLCHAF